MIELEECERIKNCILSINPERKMKTIMITSSVSGEGSSTVASNLAVSLSRNRTLKTLLVDVNSRRPTLHKHFDLENKFGFYDLIFGKKGAEGVLKRTRWPNLLVITSGEINSNPSEMLEPQGLKHLLSRLKEEFNYLIFDSPPITAYPDALLLAPQMDGVILVVQAERVRWEVVQEVKEQLELIHANIVGVVLNKRKNYIPEFIYKRLR